MRKAELAFYGLGRSLKDIMLKSKSTKSPRPFQLWSGVPWLRLTFREGFNPISAGHMYRSEEVHAANVRRIGMPCVTKSVRSGVNSTVLQDEENDSGAEYRMDVALKTERMKQPSVGILYISRAKGKGTDGTMLSWISDWNKDYILALSFRNDFVTHRTAQDNHSVDDAKCCIWS